jgi:3-oxoacyl-[acyl-carrier-protein] synthase II
MATVMKAALTDAQCTAEDIDAVCTHACGTRAGDAAESRAVSQVLNAQTPVLALKSLTGHTLGAAPTLEAWLMLQALHEGWLPPIRGLDRQDPDCATLDYVPEPRETTAACFMINSFASGGIHSALILRKKAG